MRPKTRKLPPIWTDAERDHYVYALFCPGGHERIWAKFGMSHDPLSRLDALRTSCPVAPQLMYSVRCDGKSDARMLEGWLHLRFGDYRQNGEWFLFKLEDKNELHMGLRTALVHLRSDAPMTWERLDISKYMQSKRVRRIGAAYKSAEKRRGKAA